MHGIERSFLLPTVRDLIARQPSGHSLLQSFYSDPSVYKADVEWVWRKGWLFAGHSCEIPNAGDYITLTVDTDSILVVRAESGRAHALNVGSPGTELEFAL